MTVLEYLDVRIKRNNGQELSDEEVLELQKFEEENPKLRMTDLPKKQDKRGDSNE